MVANVRPLAEPGRPLVPRCGQETTERAPVQGQPCPADGKCEAREIDALNATPAAPRKLRYNKEVGPIAVLTLNILSLQTADGAHVTVHRNGCASQGSDCCKVPVGARTSRVSDARSQVGEPRQLSEAASDAAATFRIAPRRRHEMLVAWCCWRAVQDKERGARSRRTALASHSSTPCRV